MTWVVVVLIIAVVALILEVFDLLGRVDKLERDK